MQWQSVAGLRLRPGGTCSWGWGGKQPRRLQGSAFSSTRVTGGDAWEPWQGEASEPPLGVPEFLSSLSEEGSSSALKEHGMPSY